MITPNKFINRGFAIVETVCALYYYQMAHHKACISACDVFLYTSVAIVFSMKLPIRKQTKSPHQKKHTKTTPQTRLRLNVHTCMWLGVPQPASNYCLYTSLLRLQDKMVCIWSKYICFFNITVLMRFSVAIGLKQTDKQKTPPATMHVSFP